MSLIGLMAISGIFGSKNEDLDILPPPPPFPDIGIDKKPKDAAEEEWKRGKQKIEKGEKPKKSDAKKEKIKIPKLIRGIDEGRIEFPKLEQKKSFFGKLFGKKDEELEKELEELEETVPEPGLAAKEFPELRIPKAKGKSPKALERAKPLKDISQAKLHEAEFEEGMGLDEMKKDEEEIKKAIDGMKEKSKAPIIGRFFKRKKEGPEEYMISRVTGAGKIETPGVMPRTFEKIDHVQEIEERVHKARMCLMNFKFDDAKRIYIEIMGLYNSLSQKDRYKVYQDIRDLYYERKSAEKFAKVQY